MILIVPRSIWGQDTPQDQDTLDVSQSNALRVYLDCSACDNDYVRTEITYINYVRDRREAQVHILATTQSTGSGGREYTFAFIGQETFSGRDDTLTYISRQEDTSDIIRAGIVRILKRGLMYYVGKTPQADQIEISYRQRPQPVVVEDKWDSWVFRVSGSAFINEEERSSSSSRSSSFTANRITPEWMIRLSASTSRSEDRYTLTIPGTTSRTIKNVRTSSSSSGLIVKSLTDHWSAGLRGTGNSSSYSNTKRSLLLAPSVEYNSPTASRPGDNCAFSMR
ncbi:hypothetical protein ACFLZR_00615 [Candidatus Neomarinimicrobiota bacterium]